MSTTTAATESANGAAPAAPPAEIPSNRISSSQLAALARRVAAGGEREAGELEAVAEEALAGAEDALFRSRGWVVESHDHDTVFQLAGVATVRRRLPACARS